MQKEKTPRKKMSSDLRVNKNLKFIWFLYFHRSDSTTVRHSASSGDYIFFENEKGGAFDKEKTKTMEKRFGGTNCKREMTHTHIKKAYNIFRMKCGSVFLCVLPAL